MKSVYSAVRTGALNKAVCASSLNGQSLSMSVPMSGGWVGRNSVVIIAAHSGLGGPGLESRCVRDFPHPTTPAPRPAQPPVQRTPGHCRVVNLPGCGLTHPPSHLAPRVKKEYCYAYTPPVCLRDMFYGELARMHAFLCVLFFGARVAFKL